MVYYILKRIAMLIPVLFGVTILVFAIMHLSPGDPAKIMLGPKATQESIEKINIQLGLDKSIVVQYVSWLGDLITGDWGRSIQKKMEVLPLVLNRFGATALLTFTSALIATSIGIGVGIISAYKKDSTIDRGLMLFVLTGFSLPGFWLGIILQIIFGLKLNILPISGMHESGVSSFGDLLSHLILPSIALSAGVGAIIARMVRSEMLEVLGQDYIRTARSKGIKEKKVIFIHALKNAFIPVLTVLGMQVGFLLAGSILIEKVFSWPGIGALMIDGILARDFPVVQGSILLVASTYVFVNLLVDVLYATLDPRISL